METILFNIFALLAVLSALLVVVNPLSRNPVTSAMFLVTTMISISGLFVLLNAYFLAAVQILVYAGAVMVLFLFVIMLLDVEETARRKLRLVSLTMGFLSVAALFGVYKSSLEATYVKDVDSSQDIATADEIDGFWSEYYAAATSVGESESLVTVGSTQALGKELFSSVNGFILPFEIVSILLLVAMIGVILLSKKDTK
ncbi:MAG: NADH-quinone oxidoreductase subunit J [Limisphaerales bacterium]|nr:MAG: NADH-quinone oxidoreductase subunit J [Limisphaerales bacterium]